MIPRVAVLMVLFAGCMGIALGEDQDAAAISELEVAIAKPWKELTVVLMVDPGCVARIYRGFVVTRGETGFEIASWQKEYGNETKSEKRPLPDAEVKLIQQVLPQHYQTAVEFEDARERLEKIDSPEEREQERAKIIKEMGGAPIGGFEQIGIEISIAGNGFSRVFKNGFGRDYQSFTSLVDKYRELR